MEQRYLDALQDQQTFDANLVAQEYTVYDEYARQWTYLGETAATWQRNIDKMDEIGQCTTAATYRKIADALARLNREGPPSLRHMVLDDAASSVPQTRPAETCQSVHAVVPVTVDNRPFAVCVVYEVCADAISLRAWYHDAAQCARLLTIDDALTADKFWYALCCALSKVAQPYMSAPDDLAMEHITLGREIVPHILCWWPVQEFM